MDPKAAQTWNFALDKIKTAGRYIEQNKEQLAKTEIAKALYVGAGTIYYICGPGEQDRQAYDAAQAFIAELAAADYSAEETLQDAKKVLNYIADLCPGPDHLPRA